MSCVRFRASWLRVAGTLRLSTVVTVVQSPESEPEIPSEGPQGPKRNRRSQSPVAVPPATPEVPPADRIQAPISKPQHP